MTTYLINSAICLFILLMAYHLLLENESMHRFKRFFLLFSIIFGLLVYWLKIDIEPGLLNMPDVKGATIHYNSRPINNISLITHKAAWFINPGYLKNILIAIYALGAIIMLIRFAINIRGIIHKIVRNPKVRSADYTIVLLAGDVVPHSFMNYIFLSKDAYLNDKIDDKVIMHEYTHITQKHIIDVLLLELLMIVWWFNPLFYYYKKAIMLNHEFLADESTVRACGDLPAYQQLLLQISTFKTVRPANNLNYSITKKRLIMMKKQTSKTIAALKSFAMLPLLALLVILFSNMTPVLRSDMQYALVGNESFTNMPKFELDLYSGNRDFAKADNLIWLSVSTLSVHVLASGEYNYSSKNLNNRGPFKFMGSVKNRGIDVPIADGSVRIRNIDEQNIAVNYDLVLKDGTRVTGQYNGKYQTADWSHYK